MPETDTQLQQAADFFHLGSIMRSEATKLGIGNENYYVETPQGEFVLRRLWEQTIEGLQNELAIQQQLGAVEILTAHLLMGENNSFYYQSGDQVITSSKKIDGKHPNVTDERLVTKMGSLLAQFHQSVTTLPVESKRWLNKESALAKAASLPESPLKQVIDQRLGGNMEIFDQDLPSGIIHGDLYAGNLLLTPDNQLVIFDFETAERNLFIVDIARPLIDTPYQDAFLDGYQQIRKLSKAELDNLQKAKLYVSGAVAAWLIDRGQEKVAKEILQRAE